VGAVRFRTGAPQPRKKNPVNVFLTIAWKFFGLRDAERVAILLALFSAPRSNQQRRMTAKKKTRPRKEASTTRVASPSAASTIDVPLRGHAERALTDYFTTLNGHRPAHLYDLVMREVEEPLFKTVMDYAQGNQCRAADILGINRGTLRKKLKEFGLSR
jgi:Fis family transcriptional regulator